MSDVDKEEVAAFNKWAREYASQGAIASHHSTIEFARDALKGIVIINGAAAAAMLALISQVASKCTLIIPTLAPVLGCFAAGVLAGGFATALSYMAQVFFSHSIREGMAGLKHEAPTRWGNGHQIAALVVALVGYGAFALGAWNAANALQNFDWSICNTVTAPT
jgi:hypothetical protein